MIYKSIILYHFFMWQSFQACVVLLYVAIVMLGVLVGLVDKLLVM